MTCWGVNPLLPPNQLIVYTFFVTVLRLRRQPTGFLLYCECVDRYHRAIGGFYNPFLRAIVGPGLHHLQRLLKTSPLLLEVYLYLVSKRILVGYDASLPPALDFENPHQTSNGAVVSIAA